jgi:cation diffusion facilitator family transporter
MIHANPKEPKESESQHLIRRVTWIGLVINVCLTVLKFAVGLVGKSQAVIADAVHSLSDLVTDFAVLFGVRFWEAPADDEHPYGHHRIQTLITIVIGFSLAFVALGILCNTASAFQRKEALQPGWIALLGPFCAIVLKEILYRWTVAVGKKTHSGAVIANAWHHRSDALSSIPAFLSVFLARLNPAWAFFDPLGAFIVALFILKVSWDIIKPELLELTEHAASARDRGEIERIVDAVSEVKSVHKIRTRKMGSGILLDLHIEVDAEMSVKDGHLISQRVKRELIEKGPNVIDVVVHLEPYTGTL